MFPFWELAVGPVLDAVGARRVVEIGALRGEHTVLMLERLGPDTELHVIDPVPDFDPGEHERAFPGRYVFHRDLSLNVLGQLPSMDVALVDGDHNWYTVYNELTLLAQVARDAGDQCPVFICHDVLWPYGRRDLYYNPDNIPDEHRRPYDRRGMSPHKKKLLERGGLNAQLANAVEEGGPHNGVMTGIDDFMAEYPGQLRFVLLPIYFGLAIIVDEERLAANPALAEVLDRLESREGRYDLLQLSEDLRIQQAVFQQSVFAIREQQLENAATRYLNLLKGALLDEHYIENELRIEHLVRAIEADGSPSPVELRDPARAMRRQAERLRAARHSGRLRGDESDDVCSYFPFTSMGRVRLDHLQSCLDELRREGVAGDLVECGTGRGGGGIFLRGYLDAHMQQAQTVWVADMFRASPPGGMTPATPEAPVPGGGPGFPELQADLNTVRDGFDRFDLFDDRVRFLQGEFTETLPEAPIGDIALLRVGGQLGLSAGDVLDELYDRLTMGGYVIIEDYVEPTCAKAIDEFRARRGIGDPLERIDWSGAYWRKQSDPAVARHAEPEIAESGDAAETGLLGRLRRRRERAEETPAAVDAPTRAVGAPLAPTVAPGQRKALSVIVVFYNMRREAARTLHALSRSYQQGIDDLDYEVIAIENGSSPDQRLDADFVRSFGPEFRLVDLGEDAQPSPVFALNHGVALSSGDVVALMIDGAHIVTPGVFANGLAGLSLYGPAIVTTQQWYVGPGQQPDMMADGYDQAHEDDLFERIKWPFDGYRLFDIGHAIGGRDWFDGIWESNCLFVPRNLLEQVGVFDESFVTPGGAYANLELYERLGSTPGVSEVTILGEASFHQVHGGTTTNQTENEERMGRIRSYGREFSDIRGRTFRGPNKRIHFVGTMFTEACRTRSRRTTAPMFFQKWSKDDPDGAPKEPVPIPEDLKLGFTEAYWHNLGWRRTSWLGRRLAKSPGDLMQYQELVHQIRPDWIITMRTNHGGMALYLASLCDLVDHGQVLSIDDKTHDDLPEHERIHYLVVPQTHGDEAKAAVAEIVGDKPRGLLFLGSSGTWHRVMREFETYHEFVPKGSYAVVENTIVGGHPVWPSYGPGPAEAVREIVNQHLEFVPDPNREKFGLSFNPDGYLKRIR